MKTYTNVVTTERKVPELMKNYFGYTKVRIVLKFLKYSMQQYILWIVSSWLV